MIGKPWIGKLVKVKLTDGEEPKLILRDQSKNGIWLEGDRFIPWGLILYVELAEA